MGLFLLVLGVAGFAIVHFFSTISRGSPDGLRARLINKLGDGPYKGLFALDLLLSIVLIVFGWRMASAEALYEPIAGARWITIVSMLVVFLFLGAASKKPNPINQRVRHPMLTGVVIWAAAHLLANPELRSVILFGGIGLWAIISIVLINRRDGVWHRPEGNGTEPKRLVAWLAPSLIIFVIFYGIHPLLFGVSPHG